MLIQAMWIEAEDYRQRRRFSLFIWGGRLVGACDEQEYRGNTKGSAKSGQLLGLKMLDEGEAHWLLLEALLESAARPHGGL